MEGGFVFLPQQPITVATSLPASAVVNWTLRDGWGAVVDASEQDILDVSGAWRHAPLACGFYALSVSPAGDGEMDRRRFIVTEPAEEACRRASPYGAMTLFGHGWPTDLLPTLTEAGIGLCRDEVHWDAVERSPGAFDFSTREPYMRAFRDAGVRPLIVLACGNPVWYSYPGVPTWASAPFDDEAIAAYGRYAAAVVRHYGDSICGVEVWNEYNGGFARGPADGRPDVYARMLAAAFQAIKAVRTDVPVLGCSTVGVPLPWIEDVFRNGGLANMDGVAVHPYACLSAPEGIEKRIEALRESMRRHGGEKPVWVTEHGYFTTNPGQYGHREVIDELAQARYLTRSFALLRAGGAARVVWCLARDDRAFPTMGLVASDNDLRGRYAPKPALAACAGLIRATWDATDVALANPEEGVYACRFERPAGPVTLLWSLADRKMVLPAEGPARCVDLFGSPRVIARDQNGDGQLRLTSAPLWLQGDWRDLAGAGARLDALAGQAHAGAICPPGSVLCEMIDVPRAVASPDGSVLWDAVPEQAIPAASHVRPTDDSGGQADLSARFRAAWDEQALHLLVEVTDDVHGQPHSGSNAWRGDGLQIGISGLDPWADGEWPLDAVTGIGVALAPAGPHICRTSGTGGEVAGARADIARNATTIRYTLLVPWAAVDDGIPARGRFSLGICVHDDDGAGRKGVLKWGDIDALHTLHAMRLKT